MFKELAPYLRQRAVLLTVTHLEEDQIRVNVIPQKLKDGDNNALTTPLSVTGTAEELDRELPPLIGDRVQLQQRPIHRTRRGPLEIHSLAVITAAMAWAFEFIFCRLPLRRATQMRAARKNRKNTVRLTHNPHAVRH